METLEKWTQRVWTVLLVLLAAFFVNQYAEAKELTIPVKIVKSKTDIWVMVIDTGIASHPDITKLSFEEAVSLLLRSWALARSNRAKHERRSNSEHHPNPARHSAGQGQNPLFTAHQCD